MVSFLMHEFSGYTGTFAIFLDVALRQVMKVFNLWEEPPW